MFGLKNLQLLELNFNPLKNLPESIKKLINLKHLFVYNTTLELIESVDSFFDSNKVVIHHNNSNTKEAKQFAYDYPWISKYKII